jgi:hypothetical protein
MELVLSGIVPYAGEAYNEVDNREYLWLKTIETGACPSFSLFYADNTVLRNTDYTYLTSNHYSLWLEDSIQMMKEYQTLREKVKGSYLKGHRELQAGVYQSLYANGWTVIVNYNNQPVLADGQTVESMSYIMVKEG